MPIDNLFADVQKKRLFSNHYRSICMNIFEPNFVPVACLDVEKLGYKLLVTQIPQNDEDCAFVLFDHGNENITLEVIRLSELEKQVENAGDILRPDPTFVPKYNIAIYAKVADTLGKIVTDDQNEKAKKLFSKFNKEDRYKDEFKNVRRFRYECIW